MDEDEKCSSVQSINKTGKTLSSCDSLEALTAAGFKMLAEATKKSNNLPFGKIRNLYESYPSFHNVVKTQLERVLNELSVMMTHTSCKRNISKKDDEDKFELIVDANDGILENVGTALDELCGISKNPDLKFISKKVDYGKGSWNNNKSNKMISKAASQILNNILNQTKNIEKPQIKFKDRVNNDSDVPFEPRIKHKYNMLKPLSCILQTTEDGICHFTHPYEFELIKFIPPKEQLEYHPPKLYKSLVETPLVLIIEPEDVNQMVNDLEKYTEIAVDVEHHSYRSFQGFTCLMQISTRDVDYIIDTLALRSDLEILNRVFTNSSIVKVFHGADLDIVWLQKDLSLYVVNMFDTHQAAKLLNFPKLSLGYLLSHYCNVEAQKHFQLADWRIRPLPKELLTYAREDTHYLLFIYDNLRNALIEKANHQTNLLQSVISESTRICLKTYLKPRFEKDGYLDIYHRSKKLFDNRQKFALEQLFLWRDTVARECDESYAYVLPDHMMLNISEVLPREAQGILACCNPVPVPVRQNLMALHQIILKAREQPLLKPILEEQKFYRYTSSVNSLDNPLQCPHDLNYEGEFRDDLPVLCSPNDNPHSGGSDISRSMQCSTPIISVFEGSADSSGMMTMCSIAKSAVHFTPYHLYKLSKKFSESIEMKNLCTNKHIVDKVRESPETAVTKTGPKVKPDKDSNDKSESTENNVEEMPIPERGNVIENGSTPDKEKMISAHKRKISDMKSLQAKKLKKEVNVVKNLSAKEDETDTNMEKKEKKKRIFLKAREKQFQPFDYNSIDFEKYKSSAITLSKKVEKVRKPKKKGGKKNFKISI